MATAKAKSKIPTWDKDNTGFVDCDGKCIRGGSVVEYWDSEGGSGVGVVDFKEKRWLIVNSWEAKQHKFKITTAVQSFAPSNVRVLGYN